MKLPVQKRLIKQNWKCFRKLQKHTDPTPEAPPNSLQKPICDFHRSVNFVELDLTEGAKGELMIDTF